MEPESVESATLARTVPVYLIIDESVADPTYFELLNNGIKELLSTLARQRDIIRLGIFGYGNTVVIKMPLTAIAADTFVPPFSRQAGDNLYKVLAYLHERIPEDVNRLKFRQMTVGRPIVHLLCATPPAEESSWEDEFRKLVDRTSFPYAPNIFACGVGGMSHKALQKIATQTGCHAFSAGPALSLEHAAQIYISWLKDAIDTMIHAYIDGSNAAIIEYPKEFQQVSFPRSI